MTAEQIQYLLATYVHVFITLNAAQTAMIR